MAPKNFSGGSAPGPPFASVPPLFGGWRRHCQKPIRNSTIQPFRQTQSMVDENPISAGPGLPLVWQMKNNIFSSSLVLKTFGHKNTSNIIRFFHHNTNESPLLKSIIDSIWVLDLPFHLCYIC